MPVPTGAQTPSMADIIQLKRSGAALSEHQIDLLIDGLSSGRTSDGHLGALCSSIAAHGLNWAEAGALATALARSTPALDWDGTSLAGPTLSAHQNYALGDYSAALVGALAAAGGGFVPRVSSKGATGINSIADKLAAIPGFQIAPPLAHFRQVVREVGFSVCGYGDADMLVLQRFHRARSETATIDCVPLLAVSFLARTHVASLDGLLIDIKCGSGSSLRTIPQAQELAAMIHNIAGQRHVPSVTIITSIDQPVSSCIGAALELKAVADYLSCRHRESRMTALVSVSAAELLALGRLTPSIDEGEEMIEQLLLSGHAAEVFDRMVEANGGPADFVASGHERLEIAPEQAVVTATQKGVVNFIDMDALRLAHVALGGARLNDIDDIDTAVGFSDIVELGTPVKEGDALLRIHARSAEQATHARETLAGAFRVGAPTRVQPIVLARSRS